MKYFVSVDGQDYVVTPIEGGQVKVEGSHGGEVTERQLDARLVMTSRCEGRLLSEAGQRRLNITSQHRDQTEVAWAGGPSFTCRILDERAHALGGDAEQRGESALHSRMPGVVLAVHVELGQRVERGQALLILEAMKTENEINAECDGIVAAIHVAPGQTIENDALLIELEPSEAP